jgi:hypothetical protein
VSTDQLLVLVLLAAAFVAGWVARGGRSDRADAEEASPAPAATPEAAAVVAGADAVLRRALTAAGAARAVAAAPAGTSEAATRAALRVLDQRLTELEDVADELETARGAEDEAFLAFDGVVSSMATLRRRVDGDAALAAVEAAQAGWERALRR